MRQNPLAWIKSYPDCDDVTSLRHMLEFAKRDRDEAHELACLLDEQEPDMGAEFIEDRDEAEEAIRLIEARLAVVNPADRSAPGR